MTKDMTTGAITPLLVKFTIPLVLGNLFQLTYNAADSIIVGKFVGEDALAAVGTSNPLMTLAILFINGLCLGAGILVSTAYGAGDTQRVERQVSTTAIAGTVFSLVFSALCVLLATPLLRLMQVPEEILPIAVQYLRIVFAGLIFTFFYNFLAATMRALGDSKSALYFLMISSVLNIGGDLFFVEVLGWGSEGCALSTVLSWGLYGTRCCEFLFGHKVIKPYQIIFCLFMVVGATMKLDLAWSIADTLNGLMAIPNLIGLLALSPVVFKLTRDYFRKQSTLAK